MTARSPGQAFNKGQARSETKRSGIVREIIVNVQELYQVKRQENRGVRGNSKD